MANVAKPTSAQLARLMESAEPSTNGTDHEPEGNPKTKQTSDQERILRTLRELGGGLQGEDDVTFEGAKFVIPSTVTLKEAYNFLGQKIRESSETMQFRRTFHYRPWDGAYCAYNAMKKCFGLVSQRAIMTFFGPQPPEMRDVIIGPKGETAQVPWGRLNCAALPNAEIYFGGETLRDLGTVFQIAVEAPRSMRFEIQGFFRLVQDELDNHSIYRGHSFDGQENPNFIDLDAIDANQIIYSRITREQLEANLWSLIRYSATMRMMGESLKRSALLEGSFGTGKSLTAARTAQIANEAGWTFIQVRAGRDKLEDAMQTARMYQPCVVFFEDIDTIAGVTADSAAGGITKLLDMFDGIQAKGTEILVVMTTNHAEKIQKGMVRPGRLDSIIHFGSLDQEGHQQLIQVTVPPRLLADNIDYAEIHRAVDGYMPAFVREVIGRATRYAISRNGGQTDFVLETHDFVAAAEGLRDQERIMNQAPEGSEDRGLDGALRDTISDVLNRTHFVNDDGQVQEGRSAHRLAVATKTDPIKQVGGR